MRTSEPAAAATVLLVVRNTFALTVSRPVLLHGFHIYTESDSDLLGGFKQP